MNGRVSSDAEIALPLRGVPTEGWRWQDNELSIVFQPIIGLAAFALYCHLTGKAYQATFPYTLRGLADETKRSRTTIWRAMAVLKHLGMVRIKPSGGNQESECSLVDLKKLAVSLGASYNRKVASYFLEPSRVEELRGEIAVMLSAMQVKHKAGQDSEVASLENASHQSSADLFLLDSRRDAGVSPEKHQWSSGETQTGFHLIRENTRLQNVPTPTPSHNWEVQTPEDLPHENEPVVQLKWASDRFNGVMDEMRAHLLNTDRATNPHLANGYADWDEFGFNSLAVFGAEWRGKGLVLMLSASDPAAARRGLFKYRRTWEQSLRKWFGSEVEVELQLPPGKR